MITSEKTVRRTKVMFLAWGESIHARRRIRLFADDPSFDIAVVSTFNYKFDNAKNYLLDDAKTKQFIALLISYFFLFLKLITFKNTLTLLFEDFWKIRKDLKILKNAYSEFQPDIIFLQTLLYPCYLAYALPKKTPVIITFWNGDVTWWAKWNGLDRLIKKKIVVYGVKRAAAMTVNSQTAFEACLAYGVPPEKIHLIRYPGVDLERFRPGSKEDARRQLEIHSRKVVLCPRGIAEYLNTDIIIEAAALFIKINPDIVFLFISGVGGNTEWQRLLKKAAELGVADHLRRDGQVPWEKMPLYYQAADAVVSMSSNDSLPNCMLEAMACGTPLVMGDIKQIREWIEDGINGLLVPPRDSEALSRSLLRFLGEDNILTEQFSRYNLELVASEFDGRKNSLFAKKLVKNIAAKHTSIINDVP